MIEDRIVLQLIDTARAAADNAYCPYSNYPVGAAVLTESGDIFSGCNVENISFGATICAERVAACNAISAGFTEFRAICVYHNGVALPYPCGICLQFLSEFGQKMDIIVATEEEHIVVTMNDLIPHRFDTDEI